MNDVDVSFESLLRRIVKEEIQAAMGQNGPQQPDRLLDAAEVCEVLSTSPDWLYKHHKKLPFTRKLGPKMLRFSCQGIQKWLASKKTS